MRKHPSAPYIGGRRTHPFGTVTIINTEKRPCPKRLSQLTRHRTTTVFSDESEPITYTEERKRKQNVWKKLWQELISWSAKRVKKNALILDMLDIAHSKMKKEH